MDNIGKHSQMEGPPDLWSTECGDLLRRQHRTEYAQSILKHRKPLPHIPWNNSPLEDTTVDPRINLLIDTQGCYHELSSLNRTWLHWINNFAQRPFLFFSFFLSFIFSPSGLRFFKRAWKSPDFVRTHSLTPIPDEYKDSYVHWFRSGLNRQTLDPGWSTIPRYHSGRLWLEKIRFYKIVTNIVYPHEPRSGH